MVQDPCNAVLTQGIYGDSEGFLGRFRTSIANTGDPASTATCGYILVVPNYFGKDTVLTFSNADPAYNPANSSLEPYGNGTPGITAPFAQNTALASDDNACKFVQGSTASDARLISACVRMTYYGSVVESQGEVCMVENLPLATLLDGGLANATLSVNELFQHSGNSIRLGTDTLEVIYRPDSDSKNFVDGATKWSVETGATPNTVPSDQQKVKQATAFGFAWRNCLKEPAQSFAVIRNIEWRPEASLGIAAPTVKQYSADLQPTVIATLDSSNPSWTRRVLSGALSAAGQVASAAFTGALPIASQLGRFGAAAAASSLAMRAGPLLLR